MSTVQRNGTHPSASGPADMNMLDPKNGLATGDPARMAAIIRRRHRLHVQP